MSRAKEQRIGEEITPGPFEVRLEDFPTNEGSSVLAQRMSADPTPANQDELERRLECAHYEECLNLAAALDWESFTCAKCSGHINEALLWRAGQNTRRDAVAKAICGAATLTALKGTSHK